MPLKECAKWSVIVILLVIMAIGIFIAWDFTADDSYITFRYSKHLAEGNGIVFNVDDANPVEGYTNFLWMIIMTIPHLLGFSPVLFSKIVGLLCLAGCLITLFIYAGYKTGDAFFGYLAVLSLAILPATYFHTFSGMETMLYDFMMLLLFISGYELLTQSHSPSRWQIISVPVLVLITGMTRPEGLLPGCVVLVVAFLYTKGRTRAQLLMFSGLLLVIPGLIYFIWRLSYFGWLLPNTFYVKFGHPFDGVEWLAKSIGSLVGIFVIVILSYAFNRANKKQSSKAAPYYAAFLILAILPYFMSNLMMNYMNRFLFHVIPVIFLIAILDIHALFKAGRNSNNRIAASRGLIAAAVLISIFPLLHKDKTEVAYMGLYESHLRNAHIELANALKSSEMPQELRTLSVGDAGAIPYYSEWTSYDFVGLNDEFAAHHPNEKSEYLREIAPTVLIFYAKDTTNISSYQFGLKSQVLLPGYDKIASIKWFPDYYLAVFLKKDVDQTAYNELAAAIRRIAAEADRLNADADDRIGLIKYLRTRIGL